MSKLIKTVGFGGGCHWCTEAVFLSLRGVLEVQQGWIASKNDASGLSEAVIVHFNPSEIPLAVLVEIHLRTHKSSSQHSMRTKYRSAVYYFDNEQKIALQQHILAYGKQEGVNIITKVLPFVSFVATDEAVQNYYYKNPSKPFCKTYINPKLQLLLTRFSTFIKVDKVETLKT